MKKPFQVVRINTKQPTDSRKELLVKMSKEIDPIERKKILQNAMYPNILKSTEE